MNPHLSDGPVQDYIHSKTAADVHHIAMARSPFPGVSGRELAEQIASREKARKKLPLWFGTSGICFPPSLSIEQSSSEITASYKAELAAGEALIDLTGGFGVDSHYFSLKVSRVTHCELNPELSEIAAHNAGILGRGNITFIAGDGLKYLESTDQRYSTAYIDPARRSGTGKVFKLSDCTPDVTRHQDLLLRKASRVIIKTSPLLDIAAGLKELHNVSEIHIVSVRNECKELLWVLDSEASPNTVPEIIAVTLNAARKFFRVKFGAFGTGSGQIHIKVTTPLIKGKAIESFIYEPDAALLKSGAFEAIGARYGLRKLHQQTQLYTSSKMDDAFPGRIFRVTRLHNAGELKKERQLKGNVLVRNYPDRAELLTKKYRIIPDQDRFYIFTQTAADGLIIIEAEILQHY